MAGARLAYADLHESQLAGADLSSADLSRADLSGADLSGADLRGADLQEADLRHAVLESADLRGANLRGTVLDRTLLRAARYDAGTLWPETFQPLAHPELIAMGEADAPRPGGAWRWCFIAVLAASLLLDQASKALVQAWLPLAAPPQAGAGGLFALHHVRNSGVALSLLADEGAASLVGPTALLIVGVVAAAVCRSLDRRKATVASAVGYGLLLGGATGNLVDRVRLGAVTDFIRVGGAVTINLADVAVTAGLLLLLSRAATGTVLRPGTAPPLAAGTAEGGEPARSARPVPLRADARPAEENER